LRIDFATLGSYLCAKPKLRVFDLGGNLEEKAIKPKKDLKHKYENFIENQNKCPLCSSDLVIEVQKSEFNDSLKEEARCPSCDLLARIKDHNMH